MMHCKRIYDMIITRYHLQAKKKRKKSEVKRDIVDSALVYKRIGLQSRRSEAWHVACPKQHMCTWEKSRLDTGSWIEEEQKTYVLYLLPWNKTILYWHLICLHVWIFNNFLLNIINAAIIMLQADESPKGFSAVIQMILLIKVKSWLLLFLTLFYQQQSLSFFCVSHFAVLILSMFLSKFFCICFTFPASHLKLRDKLVFIKITYREVLITWYFNFNVPFQEITIDITSELWREESHRLTEYIL